MAVPVEVSVCARRLDRVRASDPDQVRAPVDPLDDSACSSPFFSFSSPGLESPEVLLPGMSTPTKIAHFHRSEIAHWVRE